MVDGAQGGGSFWKKVEQAVADLLEIKVVTVVGNVDVTISTTGDSTKTTVATQEKISDAIVTVVKLLDGDVTTVIAPDLVANADVRALHTAQVAASLQVLPSNLKELVGIGETIFGKRQQ